MTTTTSTCPVCNKTFVQNTSMRVYCGMETSKLMARATQTEIARIEWEAGTVDVTADQALARARESQPATRRPVEGFLTTFLGKGEKDKSEVMLAGTANGFSEAQIQRAATKLGVISHKSFQGHATWKLPKAE